MSERLNSGVVDLTPYSNTGGKYSQIPATAQPVQEMNFSGSGANKSPIQGEVLIDTLSFSLQLSALSKSSEVVSRWTHSDDEIIGRFKAFLYRCFGDDIVAQPMVINGRNGFDNRLILEDGAGFVAFGGNNIVRTENGPEKRAERFQVYLDGAGCAMVKDWQRLYQAMCDANVAGYDVRITRVDVAADFHEGEVTYLDAIEAYQSGLFTSRGRPPKSKLINDMGSGEGCTFYVGSRLGGKLFRAYEKGKQLGDKTSPWNRFEVEWIGDNKRVIPFEILINPKEYIAGAYGESGATAFIHDLISVIKTSAKKLKITYQTARYWCRLQYGKLINFASRGLHLADDQVVLEFFNPDGFPDRLLSAPATIGVFPQEV
tara:strand:+ start:1443 stop:2561 length:1119 start_codon:yes stop_codon:yes gene_type:complete